MQGEEEEGPAAKLGTCMSSLLSCFMSAWFIAGKFVSSILHAQTIFVKNNIDDARMSSVAGFTAARLNAGKVASCIVYIDRILSLRTLDGTHVSNVVGILFSRFVSGKHL